MSSTGGTAPSVLAFDLGASGGRAVVGRLAGDRLTVEEVHRFPNDPVRVHDHLYWDILRLFHEIKIGLRAARRRGPVASVGIDSWAVDFGLLDTNGELLGNPHHYRDSRTNGIAEQVWSVVPRDELFARTGIQMLPFNTIYQLVALKRHDPARLERAATLLLIPELLRFFLTGERHAERTNASTTQLFNPFVDDWDAPLLDRLGLPRRIFSDVVDPGTPAGTLLPAIAEESGVPAVPVIAVGEHDTASAVAAVPTVSMDFAYLSCGTWSLLGTEVTAPVVNPQALTTNVTNEIGVGRTFRLLKNITGLWLLQECRRSWVRAGRNLSYKEEQRLAEEAPHHRSLIDPDAPCFLHPEDMARRVQQYCRETGQPVPESDGAIVRCIVESLALKSRLVLESIEELVDKRFPGLHMVGGGVQNRLLCQCTADALGRPLWAGPQEATALGNLLVQFIASRELADLASARAVVRASYPVEVFQPVATESEQWADAYARFRQLVAEQKPSDVPAS